VPVDLEQLAELMTLLGTELKLQALEKQLSLAVAEGRLTIEMHL
jgi:hypothetical protein